MRAVAGQHGIDPVGHGLGERVWEVSGDAACGLFVQFDKGELGDLIDSNQEGGPALGGLHLGDTDMEVTERIGLELTSTRSGAFEFRQSGDAVPLQAPVQARRGQYGGAVVRAAKPGRSGARVTYEFCEPVVWHASSPCASSAS